MKLKSTLCAMVGIAMLGSSVAALANDPMMHDKDMMMKSMDSNADGMISKEEYMAYYQKKWDGMKKNSSGMVDGKMMMMSHEGMMKDKSMSDKAMSTDDTMNH